MSSSGEYLPRGCLRNNCSPQPDSAGPSIDEISPYYGYVPTLAVTIIFTVLFSISTSTCCSPGIRSFQLTLLLQLFTLDKLFTTSFGTCCIPPWLLDCLRLPDGHLDCTPITAPTSSQRISSSQSPSTSQEPTVSHFFVEQSPPSMARPP